MRCDRVQYLYDEYSLGTLPVSTLGRVEEHLAACPTCREFFDQSDVISALVRKSTEVAHPGPQYFEDLNNRVLAALDHPEAQKIPDPAAIIDIPSTQWRRPLWWVGGMAAAALFGVAMLPGLLSRPVPAQKDYLVAQATVPQPPPTVFPKPKPVAPAPAQVQNLGAVTPVPGQTWDKSALAGSQQGFAMTVPANKYGLEDSRDASQSDLERKAAEETQARMAALRQTAQTADPLPPEVFKQLQLLKTQIIEGGNEGLRRSLRELETLVDPLVSEQIKNNSPLVKQANLYLRANDDLIAGRTDDALSKYSQILFVDESLKEKSPVAIKASLQMADLFYSELANFNEAKKYYQICLKPEAKGVLNSIEMKHVQSQLDRLERYKANNGQALELLHKVHQGKWEEVLASLRVLTTLPGTSTLLPEAANTILNRMDLSEDIPTSEITLGLYKLLENQARVEQNVDVRAWLELALGDIAFTQFQDPPEAIKHYGKAADSGSSDATAQARAKLNQMRNENLAGLVRNRN